METVAQGAKVYHRRLARHDLIATCVISETWPKEPITQDGAKPTTELNVAWEEPKYM